MSISHRNSINHHLFPIHETETSVSLTAIIYSSRISHSEQKSKYRTQMLSIQFVTLGKKRNSLGTKLEDLELSYYLICEIN